VPLARDTVRHAGEPLAVRLRPVGGGFELKPGVVARALAPAHVVAVASPGYLKGRKLPKTPQDLAAFDMIAMRSPQSGRVKSWSMRNRQGNEMVVDSRSRVVIDNPEAICSAVLLGMGVGVLQFADMAQHFKSGALKRLLPDWYADIGVVSLYFTSQKLLPAKTRAFVDFVSETFLRQQVAKRYSAI